MSSIDIGWETGDVPPSGAAQTWKRPVRRRPGALRLVAHALAASLLASVLIVVAPGSAVAHHTYPKVEISGGGWGHGRGMGQYGALGYARDYGWTSRQILDHFYGGTTQGPAPVTDVLDPQRLRVQLASMNGHTTAVTLAQGRMVIHGADGQRLRTVTKTAARLAIVSGGFELQVADGCSGPWTAKATIPGSAIGVSVELDPNDPADDDAVIGEDSQTLLGVCGPVRAWYDGEIWSHQTTYGQRTVNVVNVDQYLRGVVPNEVPASWPEAVLEAQAVAARSYVLAGDTRWGSHANTCDNTYCQVYDGRVTTRGGTRVSTHSRTDAAIEATQGQVRLTSSGAVARTEFSSSTGGHTAGGDFTAVEDVGDATSANPNSSWTTTVSLSGLATSYGLGPVTAIEVTERDGHGRFGGRAQLVTVTFRDGTRTMSGSSIRRFFGLKSDLFDFGPILNGPEDEQPEPPAEDNPPDPTEEDPGPNVEPTNWEPVISEMFEQLLDRGPTESELSTWISRFDDNETEARLALALELVSSEVFAGRLVEDLYRSTFGRSPDSEGRAYWIGRLTAEGGDALTYEEIGTYFFGSAEYYRRSGATDAGFVSNLYRDLLQRKADEAGVEYWLDVLDRRSTEDVVTWFYRSDESRRGRAATLHLLATGRDPSSAQIADGAELLQTMSDLELAARYGAGLQP